MIIYAENDKIFGVDSLNLVIVWEDADVFHLSYLQNSFFQYSQIIF